MKSYYELILLPTFEERFEYLQEGIVHKVGDATFGSMRYSNQRLYRSKIWRNEIRPRVIARDNGCDLGCEDRRILYPELIRIHHINPLTPEMFDEDDPLAYDLDNLITMHFNTHQLLTYGGAAPKKTELIERKPYDHAPWRKE